MATDMDTEEQLMIGESSPQPMQIDPKRDRFPFCVVWTPLPVLSWLIPFIGHIGICREDGVILDFAGPNFVCVDNFAFGAVTRYLQIDAKVCSSIRFPLLSVRLWFPRESNIKQELLTSYNKAIFVS